jgi:hypothetical protein
MRHLAVSLSKDFPPGETERALLDALVACGLVIKEQKALKKFPGCRHWHAKLPRHPGTMELTYKPLHRQAWISVQAGRTAPWINRLRPRVRREIKARLPAN